VQSTRGTGERERERGRGGEFVYAYACAGSTRAPRVTTCPVDGARLEHARAYVRSYLRTYTPPNRACLIYDVPRHVSLSRRRRRRCPRRARDTRFTRARDNRLAPDTAATNLYPAGNNRDNAVTTLITHDFCYQIYTARNSRSLYKRAIRRVLTRCFSKHFGGRRAAGRREGGSGGGVDHGRPFVSW